MTLPQYINEYCSFYPDGMVVIGLDGKEYLLEGFNAFVCECGMPCVNYGYHKFSKVCVKCAVSELATDIIWQWLYSGKGYSCNCQDEFKESTPLLSLSDYGDHRLTILKEIFKEAYTQFNKLCNKFRYKTSTDYWYGEHKQYREEYDKIKHTKLIVNNMQKSGLDYTSILCRIAKELDVLPRDVPKSLVFIELNLLNLNRLIRQRKKQCQTNQ